MFHALGSVSTANKYMCSPRTIFHHTLVWHVATLKIIVKCIIVCPFQKVNHSVYLSLQQTTSNYRVTGKENWFVFMETSFQVHVHVTVDYQLVHCT